VLHHLQAIPVATKNTRNAADPDTDRWWLIYVALVAGGLLSWCCGVNLFEELPIPPMTHNPQQHDHSISQKLLVLVWESAPGTGNRGYLGIHLLCQACADVLVHLREYPGLVSI